MPIHTPRLVIRPAEPGEGAAEIEAIHETWAELHARLFWADRPEQHTAESQELRIRRSLAQFTLRQEFHLTGHARDTGRPLVWCGFHHLDWAARQCEIGYWVRKSAHGQGYATEAAGALLRYAFGPMEMRRVGLSHAAGNQASQRIAEKLGFAREGVQRLALRLPGDRFVDRVLYGRLDAEGLPPLEVSWSQNKPCSAPA